MLASSVYETLFKKSPVGCYLLSTTPDVTILDVNESFLQTTSLNREALVGKGLFEVFPDNPNDLQDTGVKVLKHSIDEVINTGKRHVMPLQRYPIPKHLADGTVIFEERFWSASNTPVFDSEGKMVCIFHTTIDITKQVHAEDALRKSETEALKLFREAQEERNRLQVIIDTIPTGLIMLDASGALLLENAEWKRTWAGSRHLGSGLDYDSYKGFWPNTGEPISYDEWPGIISLTQGIPKRDVILDIERFNGMLGTILISSAPLFDESGKVVGVVVANMDISELRAAQAKLEIADVRKDEFLAMLSHELRNPLAPIQNSLFILDNVIPDSDQALRAREVIARQVTHLTRLVDDLLDVTRIINGKIELETRKLDVNAFVTRTAEDYRQVIEARNLDLKVIVENEPQMIEGDETRLTQVIGNLLSNAAKFTLAGGLITLKVENSTDKVIITVQDSGIGIEPDFVHSIFDPFTQGRQNFARSKGGLGLGLALVKGVVELHGGSVEVKSKLHIGSLFSVEIPKLRVLDKSEGAAAPSIVLGTNAYRVLIVDDNADSADSLAELIEIFGHKVEVAYTGRMGVTRAIAGRPDIVMCDIGLPDIDGYEVAETLRRELPGVRLYAISGYAQPEDVVKALNAGFNAHFAKPIDLVHVQEIFQLYR